MSDEEKQISKNDILFAALVRDFESMAMMGFGKLVDPVSGKAERNLDRAQIAIDMLGMLDDKTRGNLDETQSALMRGVLTNLRLNYLDEFEKEKKERESPREGGTEGEATKQSPEQTASASDDGASVSEPPPDGETDEESKEPAGARDRDGGSEASSGEKLAAQQGGAKKGPAKPRKRGAGGSSGKKTPGPDAG